MDPIGREITVQETTVADLNGVSCGAGNLWDGEVSLTTWSDSVPEFTRRVAVGACIEAGAGLWLVVALHDPPGRLGSVTLRRVG